MADNMVQHGRSFSATIRYAQLAPAHWLQALVRLQRLGITTLVIQPEWALHMPNPQDHDFTGHMTPQANLLGLLKLAHRLEFTAILDLGGLVYQPAWLGTPARTNTWPDLHQQPVAAAVKRWATLLSEMLIPHQYPHGLLIGLASEGPAASIQAFSTMLAEAGLRLPRMAPLPVCTALSTAQSALNRFHWPDALYGWRADGSLRSTAWFHRSVVFLTSMSPAAATEPLQPSADGRHAWADRADVLVEVRHAGNEAFLCYVNRQAETYSGMLTYRGVDDTLLHLHVVLGPHREGFAVLRNEELVGVAVASDASEGTWLARSIQSSASFSGGSGAALPCDHGLLVMAGQSGRFQMRRQEGWHNLQSYRLTLRGELLPASHRVESNHLNLPYIASDQHGDTDCYLILATDQAMPGAVVAYLQQLLRSRALLLQEAPTDDDSVAYQLAQAAEQCHQAGASATSLDLATYQEVWRATEAAAHIARQALQYQVAALPWDAQAQYNQNLA